MNGPGRMNPWAAAALSWVLATGLATAGYAVWQLSQGKAMNWQMVGEAAVIALPLALFRAWRDKRSDG